MLINKTVSDQKEGEIKNYKKGVKYFYVTPIYSTGKGNHR